MPAASRRFLLPSLTPVVSAACPAACVSGLDNAGKTTILKAICGEDISQVSPTLGFNIQTLLFPPRYRLNVWDVGGQQTIRSYWRNYYEQTDGLLFVVDSADTQRMHEVRQELHALLKQEKLAGASLLVFANKQDLKGAESLQQIADRQSASTPHPLTACSDADGSLLRCSVPLSGLDFAGLSGSRHCHIVSCSAVTGAGLQEGMEWLVQDIASRIYMMD